VAKASRELGMPKTTVWKALRKKLCLKPYKLQLLQALTASDKMKRRKFCEKMQLKMEEDGFMERLIFSDEATFHISGKVNRSNIRIWGTEHPHAMIEHQRDSEKVTGMITFSLGHLVRQILPHAISFFGDLLKTAFMYHQCKHPSSNFVIG
jgi:hypothetical protein